MKVTFKYGISGFTGKVDGNSIYFSKDARRYIVRRIGKFTENHQHSEFRSVQMNMWDINPSEAYKDDLRRYIELFRRNKHNNRQNFVAWSNVWQLMMYEMQRLKEGIDLKTITRQQIYDNNLPCICVADAVRAKLIPYVKGFEALTALI